MSPEVTEIIACEYMCVMFVNIKCVCMSVWWTIQCERTAMALCMSVCTGTEWWCWNLHAFWLIWAWIGSGSMPVSVTRSIYLFLLCCRSCAPPWSDNLAFVVCQSGTLSWGTGCEDAVHAEKPIFDYGHLFTYFWIIYVSGFWQVGQCLAWDTGPFWVGR